MSAEQEREARRAWAKELLRRAPKPWPAYGSPEWLALPEGALKVASCVAAAEAWVVDGELADDLHEVRMAQAWQAAKDREDAAWAARGERHQTLWDPGKPGFRAGPGERAALEQEWHEWTSGAA